MSAAYMRNADIAFAFIVVGTGFVGFSVPAYAPNVIEIGGSQSSAVFAVMNTVSSIGGFVAPQLAGALTASFGAVVGFRLLFWLSCCIYMLSTFIWLFGVSLEIIPEGATAILESPRV